MQELEKEYANRVRDNPNQRAKYWQERTNQPYKNIIKDEKAIKVFLDKPRIANKNEEKELKRALIVHKVTDADKEGVDDEFKDLQGKLEKHNNELKVIMIMDWTKFKIGLLLLVLVMLLFLLVLNIEIY